jgi:hypothetical protein
MAHQKHAGEARTADAQSDHEQLRSLYDAFNARDIDVHRGR